MSLQVGIDASGRPIYAWELPADVLARAAAVQRCEQELEEAEARRDEAAARLNRLPGRWRNRDLRSFRQLEAEVQMAILRLDHAFWQAQDPTLETALAGLSQAAERAAAAIDCFGQADRYE